MKFPASRKEGKEKKNAKKTKAVIFAPWRSLREISCYAMMIDTSNAYLTLLKKLLSAIQHGGSFI